MKNKIINPKYFKEQEQTKEKKANVFNNNKEIGGQYIDFNCIIYDEVDNKNAFKMIKFKIKFNLSIYYY